jgi:hypothetical protein
MLDPIYYDFLFTTLADPEPGAGAETLIYRLQLRLHNTSILKPACLLGNMRMWEL